MTWFVSFPLETYQTYGKSGFDGFAAQPGFTIENARAMMWFAQLSYEYEADKDTKLEEVRKLWGFDSIKSFEAKQIDPAAIYDSHGVIGVHKKAVLIAFAGTDPFIWETVLTDLKALPNDDDVHAGFADAENGVRGSVEEAVKLSQSLQRPLFMSGHSLGASIAALAAVRALRKGCAPMAVYTYGMPRTGGEKFKARYDDKLGPTTYRLVNGPDVVPTVPPTFFGRLAYRHVGRLLWCGTCKSFDANGLRQIGSNKPGLGQSVLKTGWDVLKSMAKLQLSSPPGPGEYGRRFEVLPLNARQHLQDQYLRALGVPISVCRKA